LFADIDALNLLLARARGEHIEQVITAGSAMEQHVRVAGITKRRSRTSDWPAGARVRRAGLWCVALATRRIGGLTKDLGPFCRSSARASR